MKSRIRVALIAPYCDGGDVGEAWSTFQWVRGLSERHEVTVLSIGSKAESVLATQLPQTQVVEWTARPIWRRFERFNATVKPGYFSFYRSARRWLEQRFEAGRPFDLIHQLSPLAMRYPSPGACLPAPLIVGPLGGSICPPREFDRAMRMEKWYSRLRLIDRWRFKFDPLLRETISGARAVIGVAPYVKQVLSDIPIRRFEVMSETGVEAIHARSASGLLQKRFRLLYVGRVVRRKGIRELVEAMRLLERFHAVTLEVVGDGDDLPACRELSRERGVSSRVRFSGRLSRAEVADRYSKSDAFVFPSFCEPSGNAVLEALSHGLPVVACDNGGPANVVDSTCGITIPVISPDQLARDLASAVRTLYEDPERCDLLATGACAKTKDSFLWDRKIDWMCDLYRDVLRS